MLALSRPPDCSSPLPSRTLSPRPNSRATSARVVMLTMPARNLASSPSDLSGKARYPSSVTTSPITAWAGLLIASFPRRVRSIVCELQGQQHGPPGGHIRRAPARPQVAAAAAPRAEAPTVRPAQGGEGHRQHHRVADHRLEVQASLNSERIPFLTGDHV